MDKIKNNEGKWLLIYKTDEYSNNCLAIVFDNKNDAMEFVKTKNIDRLSMREFLKSFKLYKVVDEYEIVNSMAFIKEDECQE